MIKVTDQLQNLEREFIEACQREDEDTLSSIVERFDQFCRSSVEDIDDPEQRRQKIQQLVTVQQSWHQKILQIKAQVNRNLADIRVNSKKVNKYLTSY